MARSQAGESVLSRAVRIIEAFDARNPVLSVSEIARRAGLPVTTAHRLVAELIELRMLERSEGHAVRVSARMWELSARSSRIVRLRDAAMPFIDELQSVVRQHTQLAVLDDGDVLHIERLSAPGSIENATFIAGRLPWHACSAGLVLMAFASEETQEHALATPLKRYTAQTVAEPGRLRRILAEIRLRRHFVADGMILDDAAGAAAPIFDCSGRVVAALSIVVPSRPDHSVGHVPALVTAARGISRSMGNTMALDRSRPRSSSSRFLAIERKRTR